MSKISELSDGGSLLPTDFLIAVRSGGNVKVQADQTEFDRIRLGDNEKIELGNSQDISIYWDGSVGKITNNIDVTGNVTIPTGSKIAFDTDGQTYITEDQDERMRVWVANTEFMRLTNDTTDEIRLLPYGGTTYTGGNLDVTGTVTADGLTLDSGTATPIINLTRSGTHSGITFSQTVSNTTGAGADLITYSSNNDTGYVWQTTDSGGTQAQALLIAPNRDISFFEDQGVTPKLFWDASAESLGIGTSSPSQDLEILNGSTGSGIRLAATDTAYWDIERDATSGHLTFTDDGAGTVLTVGQDGNVGIGTSSPSDNLHVYAASGSATLKIESNTANAYDSSKLELLGGNLSTSEIVMGDASSADVGKIIYRHDGNTLAFNVNSTERMRIDASGRVGIGTSSPSSQYFNNLVVGNNDAGEKGITIRSNASNAGVLAFSDTDSADSGRYSGYIAYDHSNNSMRLHTNGGTERMRIDTSGHLLVGSTSAANASAGFRAYSGGNGAFTSSSTSLSLNRLSSDGEILNFQKDTTTVGSISTAAGYLGIASGDTGLIFRAPYDDILPYSSTGNTAVDATIDIGDGSYRFKDLWLSGNITMGSTSQINASNAFYLDSDIIHFRANNEVESARISGGNLLVGTTDAATYDFTSGGGTAIWENGLVSAAKSGAIVGIFNRTTSDGTILDFRKGGATVGSIFNSGTTMGVGSLDTGVLLANNIDAILPWNASTNAERDNAIDLGRSAGRFKDIHLSGGVKTGSGLDLTDGTSIFGSIAVSSSSLTLNARNTGVMLFQSGGAEKARIDSAGNLMVGTPSKYSVSKMTLEYNSGTEFGLALRDSGSSGTATMSTFVKGGSVVGTISSTASATAYNTSSDQRLKENIADADDAGSKVDAIQVRKFDWKADGSHQDYGMIAQELQAVVPEAVSGNADSEEMMGVDYSKLVPMLVKEIQHLRQRVAQLEE